MCLYTMKSIFFAQLVERVQLIKILSPLRKQSKNLNFHATFRTYSILLLFSYSTIKPAKLPLYAMLHLHQNHTISSFLTTKNISVEN